VPVLHVMLQKGLPRVAYLALADIVLRPLPSRLRRLIQPVMNPLNRFLTLRLSPLACL
jgi:hypothetical protein